jgi:hypothetical protein
MRRIAFTLLVACISAATAGPVFADPDKDESGRGRWNYERGEYRAPKYKGGEYKEEYRDGNCKIERKWTRNGSYKEEWKCEGSDSGARRGEYKEEFWDGDCKIERKWEKDGGYKEERKCGRS